MFIASLNRLLAAVIVCSLLFQSCQSGMRAITEEGSVLKEECLMPADHEQAASEALPSGALVLAPVRADARVSGESPSELLSAVVPASPPFFAGPFTASSGERVLLRQQQGQWQALVQEGVGAVVHGRTLPVVGSGDIGTLLSSLQGQDVWSSRSRLHVLVAPHMSSTPCVYVGKLGLFGGAEQSYTSAPVWSSPSREKQLHSVVVIPPGKEVRIPYPSPFGWRSVGHELHVVQEAPDASYHVRTLQANFSYSSSDQEGRNQHHSTSQVALGPSVGIPVFGVEADLQMGHHSSQAQGAQHYATSSIYTTHDGLELHASVPRTYKKKGRLLGLYKDAPITQSLKLQLEVTLERDGSTLSTPPASSPSHVRPQPVDRPGSASFSSGAGQEDMKPAAQDPPSSPTRQRREDEERRAAEARAALEEKRLADDQARLIGEKKAAEEQARLAEEELAKERIRLAKGQKIAAERLRLAKEKEAADERARLAREELEKLRKQSLLSQTTLPSQAFGAKAWSQYFGDVGAEPSLPTDISTTLSSACPFWPDKQVKDTHLLVLIPATVNGKPYNLNLLGELIEHPKGRGHATKYRSYGSDTQKQFGTQSPGRSYWALMTREVLEGSRSKRYAAQQALVAGHAKRTRLPYELPGALEAATAILSHHVRSGERLYTDNPWTYTRCRDLEDGKWPVVVGGFSSGGLHVYDYDDGSHSGGVAGFRKF